VRNEYRKSEAGNAGILLLVALVVLGLSLFCGGERYQYHHSFPQAHFGKTDAANTATIRTKLLDHDGQGGYTHNVYDADAHWKAAILSSDKDKLALEFSAYYKRKAALIAGRGTISYGLIAYDHEKRDKELRLGESGEIGAQVAFIPPEPTLLWAVRFDGVSNLLYNVSYIFSIPAKLMHGTRLVCFNSNYGWSDWCWLLGQLVVGFFLACIMLFFGTAIGTICHPWETLGNLTINLGAVWESGPGSGWLADSSFEFLGLLSPWAWGRMGWELIPHSLVGSLWDLIWGAIIAPLVDIVGLFF
jgi:hypothetical protein